MLLWLDTPLVSLPAPVIDQLEEDDTEELDEDTDEIDEDTEEDEEEYDYEDEEAEDADQGDEEDDSEDATPVWPSGVLGVRRPVRADSVTLPIILDWV